MDHAVTAEQGKGPSIKDVRSQGEWGFVQCGHFADKRGVGVLQLRTSALFGAKNSDFSKSMVCPHGQGGRGVNFSRFFFYGRPLMIIVSI